MRNITSHPAQLDQEASRALEWSAIGHVTQSQDQSQVDFPVPVFIAGIWACFILPLIGILLGVVRPLDACFASAMVMVALVVASQKPANLPPLVLTYLVWNRLLRRLLDYDAQQFSNTPPTSLIVPLLGIMMAGVVAMDWHRLSPTVKRGTYLFAAALLFGAAVGASSGLGMIFELIQWISPFGFGLYVAWLKPRQIEFDRWIIALAIVACFGMLYGWVQWLLLPPWDEFWVRHCGMGSIGLAAPMQCRFFGPFAAHGSAAVISCSAVALLIVSPSISPTLRWPMVAFLSMSSLMTGVRSAWLTCAVVVLAWLLLSRSGGRLTRLIPILALVAGSFVVVPMLPGGQKVISRLTSLGDVANDGSFQQRVQFSWVALQSLRERPLGYGLGSTGMAAARIEKGEIVAFDSGYLQPLYALGLPGAFLFFAAIAQFCRPHFSGVRAQEPEQSDWIGITRAMIVGAVMAMTVSNFFRDDFAFIFWMFVLPACDALTLTDLEPSNEDSVPEETQRFQTRGRDLQ